MTTSITKSGLDETGLDETGINLNITHIGDPPSVANLTLTSLDNTSAILTWSTNEQPNFTQLNSTVRTLHFFIIPVTQLHDR